MHNSIATEWARERAEDVQRKLDPKHPSFVKSLNPSQVSGAFMLNPPIRFCNEYLSKEMSFLLWWVKMKSHSRLDFQVYIIRAYGSPGVDGGLGLENSGACKRPNISRIYASDKEDALELTLEPNFQSFSKPTLHCHDSTGGVWPVAADHAEKSCLPCKFCKSRLRKNVMITLVDEDDIEYKVKFTNKGFTAGWPRFSAASQHRFGGCFSLPATSFDVAVDDLRKNSELISKSMWTKYYELCRIQNVLLHEDLVKHNSKLVDGIISEMIIIADDIKASKVSTFVDEFATWDRNLQGFEHLGMNVGFLHAELQQLKNFFSKSEHELYMLMYQEAKIRIEKMKAPETKFLGLKDTSKSFYDVEKLKGEIESGELKFQKELDTAW
ncbi:hypothetical protein GIB67_023432 [Kingdonia uniflora]|uniref:Uncharacterized protein n=1 Tax=Kingdonia uniflora TaxID=39325 RepID=A0A7J7P9M9_9MAGN|nr:hypothetical protein GIB67_023432 [Kingdonia uniflora]